MIAASLIQQACKVISLPAIWLCISLDGGPLTQPKRTAE